MKSREFLNELRSIFGQDVKNTIDGQEKVKKAKVNTNETLGMTDFSKIHSLAEKSKLTFNVKRSGAGLRVEFN